MLNNTKGWLKHSYFSYVIDCCNSYRPEAPYVHRISMSMDLADLIRNPEKMVTEDVQEMSS